MSNLLLAFSVQAAKGDDSGLRPGLDPDQVTPGTLGFIMTLFMVIAVIVLMKSMSRRVRRVRYRSQVAEQGTFHQDQTGSSTGSGD